MKLTETQRDELIERIADAFCASYRLQDPVWVGDMFVLGRTGLVDYSDEQLIEEAAYEGIELGFDITASMFISNEGIDAYIAENNIVVDVE